MIGRNFTAHPGFSFGRRVLSPLSRCDDTRHPQPDTGRERNHDEEQFRNQKQRKNQYRSHGEVWLNVPVQARWRERVDCQRTRDASVVLEPDGSLLSCQRVDNRIQYSGWPLIFHLL